MPSKKIMLSLLSTISLITVLMGCNNSISSETSYSDKFVSDYYDEHMQLAEKNIPELMNKYHQVIESIKNLEYIELDTTNKLKVNIPVFGGSSDSCRYDAEDLVTYFTLYDLDSTIQDPMEDIYNTTGYELSRVLTIAKDIYGNQSKQYTGSNKSKVSKINKELYNLKVLWESKYLFVLEINEYKEVPYRPYAKSTEGSSVKANWHVFDFVNVSYLGSIPFEMNSDGFKSGNTKTMTSEKIVTKRKLLPGGGSNNHIIETKKVEEKTERSLSYKDKVNQGNYNFKERYIQATKDAVTKYVLNSNEKGGNRLILK